MSRFFGSKKAAAPAKDAAPAPTLDDAIHKTDARVTALDAKIRGLNQELAAFQDQVRA